MTRRSNLKALALLACTMMAGPSAALPQYGQQEPSGTETAPEATAPPEAGGQGQGGQGGSQGGGEACAMLSSIQASVLASFSAAQATATAPPAPTSSDRAAEFIGVADVPSFGPLGVEVDPKMAMDCLNSIPFDKEAADQFIDQVSRYMTFQSTVGTLTNPPEGSGQEPLDILGSLRQMRADVKSGKLNSQYEMERQLDLLAGKSHDGHLLIRGGASQAISFQFPVALASISKDGLELPKIYMAAVGPAAGAPDQPSFGVIPGGPAIMKIDGTDVVEYLKNVTETQTFQAIDTRYNQAFARNTRDGFADFPGFFNIRSFHPGVDSVEMTFENGKTMKFGLVAAMRSDFDGVDSGEAFMKKFILGGIRTDFFAPNPTCPPDPSQTEDPRMGEETGGAAPTDASSMDYGVIHKAAAAVVPNKSVFKATSVASTRRRKPIMAKRTSREPKANFKQGAWKAKYAKLVKMVGEMQQEEGGEEEQQGPSQTEGGSKESERPSEGEEGDPRASGTALPTAEPTAFPIGLDLGPAGKVVAQNGVTMFGSFIDDDTAVLSIADFEPCNPADLQTAVRSFMDQCRETKKKRLVLEMFGNGGGLIATGFDVFKQLFPADKIENFSRLRAGDAARIYSETFSAFSEEEAKKDPDGPAGFAVTSLFAKESLIDVKGNAFKSFEDFFGPQFVSGDNFTTVGQFDFTSSDDGFDITGFGSLADKAKDKPPFSPENIVLLTDGACSSTCTILAELLQNGKGVKSVFVGGLPQNKPAAAIGGVRGSQTLAIGDILGETQGLNELFRAKSKEEQAMRDAILPDNTTFTWEGQINFRDSVRLGEDTALQFLPDEANCRLFYDADSFNAPLFFYKRVADIAWGKGKCAQGSLQGGSQGGSQKGPKQAGGEEGMQGQGMKESGDGKQGGMEEGGQQGTQQPEGCAPPYAAPSEGSGGQEPPSYTSPPEEQPTYGAPPEETMGGQEPPSYTAPAEGEPTYAVPPEETMGGQEPPSYTSPPEGEPTEMAPPQYGGSEMEPPSYGSEPPSYSAPAYGGSYRRRRF